MDPDPDTDPDRYRDPGKMCLGVGMHCPSASGWTVLMTVWKASQKQFFSVYWIKPFVATDVCVMLQILSFMFNIWNVIYE